MYESAQLQCKASFKWKAAQRQQLKNMPKWPDMCWWCSVYMCVKPGNFFKRCSAHKRQWSNPSSTHTPSPVDRNDNTISVRCTFWFVWRGLLNRAERVCDLCLSSDIWWVCLVVTQFLPKKKKIHCSKIKIITRVSKELQCTATSLKKVADTNCTSTHLSKILGFYTKTCNLVRKLVRFNCAWSEMPIFY